MPGMTARGDTELDDMADTCERCGNPVGGTVLSKVVPDGETKAIYIHQVCVEPSDHVLQEDVYGDDDKLDEELA
jgi:hypothetical protein